MTRPATTIAAFLGLAFLAGCGDHGRTDELITAGKAASTNLASYYDHLGTITTEWWGYQTAFNTLQDVTTTPELERAMNDRLAALRTRSTMASRLADVYDAVGRLNKPSSTQAAVAAAQGLGKAMSSVPKIPGSADLAGGFGQAADVLMGLKRSKDVNTSNKALTDAVSGIKDAFAADQATYEAFVRDHNKTKAALLESLAKHKLVNTSPLLEQLKLGVPWATSDQDTTRTLALTIANNNDGRIAAAWSCATSETLTMLNALLAAHQDLAQIPSPLPLERSTARATACLQGAQQ
jgi:hypothetical protein